MPLTDIGWGLFAFALGWLAINFAEAYEHLAVNIRCACGRREMRDVLCAPQDRASLAAELTKLCPWCAAGRTCHPERSEGSRSALEIPHAAS